MPDVVGIVKEVILYVRGNRKQGDDMDNTAEALKRLSRELLDEAERIARSDGTDEGSVRRAGKVLHALEGRLKEQQKKEKQK